MSEELRKCPFCGSEASVFVQRLPVGGYGVECAGGYLCGVRPCTQIYKTREEAIRAWNGEEINLNKIHFELGGLSSACLFCGNLNKDRILCEECREEVSTHFEFNPDKCARIHPDLIDKGEAPLEYCKECASREDESCPLHGIAAKHNLLLKDEEKSKTPSVFDWFEKMKKGLKKWANG